MFDIDLWREIFQSINKNRTRSLLSGFTVAFAILLFAILFGLANGLNNTFSEAFVYEAANAIYIRSGRTTKAYVETTAILPTVENGGSNERPAVEDV